MSDGLEGKNRFVIICTARTGSNLLARSLARAPQVRCFGEVAKFNFASEPNAFAPFVRLTGREEAGLASLQKNDIASFIFDVIYKLPCEAVGFKLFYEHCREGDRVKLWDRLSAEKSVKVVHLTRDATFDLYLSLLYAQRTNQWLVRHEDAETASNDSEDIEVDVEHCRAFLERYLASRQQTAERFSAHPYLEVDYSELESDLGATVSKIRRFIGAPDPHEPKAALLKQASRKAEEKVLNYKSIREAFEGTSLAHLFPFNA